MIAVLADDLTGAAEVAGSALRFGLSAEIQLDRVLPSDAEVLVIDTNTRSSSQRDAVAKARRIALDVVRLRPQVLFKKVDSVLRGHVAAELLTVREVCRVPSVLLVNANPMKGRSVSLGTLAIKGIPLHLTAFADDPEHPCRTSAVKDLLGVSDELVGLAVRDAELLPDTPIVVGETANEDDLRIWAQRWYQELQSMCTAKLSDRDATPLTAGGGEYFEAILKALGKRHSGRDDDAMIVTRGSMLVRGSMVSASSDWPEVAFSRHSQVDDVARRIHSVLQSRGWVAVRGDSSFHDRADEHLSNMIEYAKRAILECRPTVVWIEGGRTASRLMRALDWNHLEPVAIHGDGVVRLRVIGKDACDMILKPGSYPWPNEPVL